MLDLTKPIRQKNGRPARVLATDLVGPWSVAIRYALPNRNESVGSYSPETLDEIFENIPPERREVWKRLYAGYTKFRTREEAEKVETCGDPVAILHLVYEGDRVVLQELIDLAEEPA